ncbi:MAG: Lrp/AsnC family transcriptional regulator [Verrucomicrobiota bacterium]
MDPILEELQRDSRISEAQLAELFNLSKAEIQSRISAWEEDGTILGYQAVVDPERAGQTDVTALIEVKLTPERDGGFDRVARRIAKFDEVTTCYLMSGGYDLVVVVAAPTLQEVARFVAEKLSTIESVTSTATRFKLKTYKEKGFEARVDHEPRSLPVSP